ncbi:MAG: hypothetical protein FD172_3825 [Methylocystaceae bacterium]|nr:MAG: hypothetical protein FD172_3825 [Methylocystaceae bacterium]
MSRAWLRGRENIHKRYLMHVAGFNLSVLMRALFGCRTPREAADIASGWLWIVQIGEAWDAILFAIDFGSEPAFLFVGIEIDSR